MLKRYEVKYLRDGIKSKYPPKVACEICGTTTELQYHHYNSLAQMYNKWSKENDINVETVEEMEAMRIRFYDVFYDELVHQGACLCKEHHQKLHSVYGKDPSLATAGKQERWVGKQRAKRGNNEP